MQRLAVNTGLLVLRDDPHHLALTRCAIAAFVSSCIVKVLAAMPTGCISRQTLWAFGLRAATPARRSEAELAGQPSLRGRATACHLTSDRLISNF